MKTFAKLILKAAFAFVLLQGFKGLADDKNFTVVTSFYPVYISTMNIARDIRGVKVVNLTKPITGCLHDYQMTPDDMKTLSTASVFVVNGAGMEAFMEKATEARKDLKVIDASKGIELISEKTAHGDHFHESVNPHVWVSVSLAMKQVANIAEGLASADPANSEKYKYNAKAYLGKLEALKKKMHDALDGAKNKKIVTFHEAFPYFAKEFGFEIAAVIEREPGSEPNAKELAETIQIVRKSGIKVLFTEPQYPTRCADVISKETSAKVSILDPAVTGPMEADAYIRIMEGNLEALRKVLE
ncbi:MAG TPA: zinc ABC transporter substrate-binding protein [Lentisphaeria bacterium]|nr:MAG: metal ABC transporter substrate-binding protein [Lentisphaerae bacterium GWF2_50_93]HCE43970.1 zinc ABC transporter substrate-binding protein [Lentisphaeria bacterium]